jgi:hypothetical protein
MTSGNGKVQLMRLFFVTDIHGSELCFRKFISALDIYNVDVGIVLGDLAGKMVVPIIRKDDGKHEANFLGENLILKDDQAVQNLLKRTAAIGFYHYFTDQAEAERLSKDKAAVDKIFFDEITKRLQSWVALADEKLKGKRQKVYMAPGNDDPLEIDRVIEGSSTIVNCDNKKVEFDGYEMITMAYSNPTPWDTPRECSEEELGKRIDALATQIKDMRRAIFNFHVPPYGTALDLAPHLSKEMRQAAGVLVHVGSKAVAESITKYQPMLGLHGHIHESKAVQSMGRTFICNPGSEYGEGLLKGIILTLKDDKVKSHVFTSG